jgi:hypothetical protein
MHVLDEAQERIVRGMDGYSWGSQGRGYGYGGMREMHGLGMIPVGNSADGLASFYTASAGEDTSGFYIAGTDANGNTVYTDVAGYTYGASAGRAPSPTAAPSWSTALTAIGSAAPGIITAINQQNLMSANIDLARRGLPPINPASIAPQVNFGLTSQTGGLVMMLAIGLLALFALKR